MENEKSNPDDPAAGLIPLVQGSGAVVAALFALFAFIEVDFLADLYSLLVRHAILDSLTAAIGFQMSLIVSLVCFWRLWRKKFVFQIGLTRQSFYAMYLSLALVSLLGSILLFREIGLNLYKAKLYIAP